MKTISHSVTNSGNFYCYSGHVMEMIQTNFYWPDKGQCVFKLPLQLNFVQKWSVNEWFIKKLSCLQRWDSDACNSQFGSELAFVGCCLKVSENLQKKTVTYSFRKRKKSYKIWPAVFFIKLYNYNAKCEDQHYQYIECWECCCYYYYSSYYYYVTFLPHPRVRFVCLWDLDLLPFL